MTPRHKLKTLVTGATGQLGSELCSFFARDFEVIPSTRKEFDITDLTATRTFIAEKEPDVVIHPAAYTDVDGCETNKEKAFLVNAIGARNVAIATRKAEAKLVFVSTDFVFDGRKEGAYVEYDPPNPLNVYGWSKLMGERMVKKQNRRTFILRVSWLYGLRGKNFVKTMLSLAQDREELRVVNDQRGTPTSVGDVARQIGALIETDYYGLYHCTSQGSCTWYELALEIFKRSGYEAEFDPSGSVRLIPNAQGLTPITLRPVKSDELPRPAKRPKNSVLENHMLQLQHLDIMPPWEESLERFMRSIDSQRSRDHKVVMRDE